eukprot:CAMPEP_0197022794 /NCGR_PEP_ID=MMETSP1384-20130603/3605_1 /TAXON_ID=29189 /ORGANISM="Ammonia sp." /LENGTH=875 /DNA_ID=CAMNT_0042450897 /DNA_START=137 /DNA_END=2764 /DNA_ORIENTATION=-
MFRSVDMSYLQVLLPSAVAEEFADQMARRDIMQFTDLNEDFQPFQRKYTADIIKIQEIERQVKAMEELLDSYEIARDTDIRGEDLVEEKRPSDASQIIEGIGKDIGDAYKRLKEQSNVEQELKKQLSQQKDSISVLQQIDQFLQSENEAQALLRQQRDQQLAAQKGADDSRSPSSVPLLEVTGRDDHGLQYADQRDVGFKYFAGVVTIGQRVSFERQIFLTSRGNSFIQFDESGANEEDKIPFVVFFLGDQLKRSFKRLCQFMNIQICYESDDERSREDLLQEANSKRNDFYRIHTATSNQLEREMKDVSNKMKGWKIALSQEKAIRITLNKFSINQGNNFLRAEGWCPTAAQDVIREILDEVTRNKGVGRPVVQDANPRAGSEIVPTHFETNGFTATFQTIVNTYGVPRYKEFNPAVPTIVTFPFLFAVMYGDVFHGSFIFMAGLFLLIGTAIGDWTHSRDDNTRSAANARYLICMMGAFAIYCGLIYNDAMSIMINGFNKSQWGYGFDTDVTVAGVPSVVYFQKRGVYAFGIDPVWHGLDNQLTYENSLKMKLSVIIGVTQMTYGLFLKLSNHLQEGDMISVFFEFVPQFIFMMAFFGYMCFLIIYKWCIDWTTSNLPMTPSLITVLIKMILGIGSVPEEVQVFPVANTQRMVQLILVILMAVSVPWMLVFKPFLMRSKHNREMEARRLLGVGLDVEQPAIQQGGGGYGQLLDEQHGDVDDEEREEKYQAEQKKGGGGHGHGHGEEFEFSEVMIHQMIHTIEFVLGTISNTASYLRLWALSLAHAELSEVFYNQTIGSSFGMAGKPTALQIITNTVAQFVFLMATVGVLLVMDVLECFLHALRLHWVEFQNKFFYADGIPFKPFSYRLIFEED